MPWQHQTIWFHGPLQLVGLTFSTPVLYHLYSVCFLKPFKWSSLDQNYIPDSLPFIRSSWYGSSCKPHDVEILAFFWGLISFKTWFRSLLPSPSFFGWVRLSFEHPQHWIDLSYSSHGIPNIILTSFEHEQMNESPKKNHFEWCTLLTISNRISILQSFITYLLAMDLGLYGY